MDFIYWLLAFLPSQDRRIKGIPRRALAYLLSQEPSWKLPEKVASDIADAIEQPDIEGNQAITDFSKGLLIFRPVKILADSIYPASQDSTPSPLPTSDTTKWETSRHANADNPDSAISHNRGGFTGSNSDHISEIRENLSVSHSSTSDVYSKPTESILCWQSNHPKYKGDFDIYIWQPHRKPPLSNYVKFHVFNRDTPEKLRMMLLFNDSRSLCAFRDRHQKLTEHRAADEAWSPVTELVRSILVIFQTISSDMDMFLQGSSEEITRLVRYNHQR